MRHFLIAFMALSILTGLTACGPTQIGRAEPAEMTLTVKADSDYNETPVRLVSNTAAQFQTAAFMTDAGEQIDGLRFTEATGGLVEGRTESWTLRFDARGVTPGTYTGTINITFRDAAGKSEVFPIKAVITVE